MKNKMITTMIIAVAFAATLTGCGKADQAETEKIAVVEETPTPIPSPATEEPELDESEPEVTGPDFEIPEKDVLWQCYDFLVERDADILKERWIQIDSAMIAPGLQMSEVMENIKVSKVKYESNYVEDKLVAVGESSAITFTREGFDWFTVRVLNCFDETMSVKDLPVVSVSVLEDAKPYCYFAAGFSGSDTVGLSYNDVKIACEEKLKGWTYSEEPVKHMDTECLKMTYFSPYEYSTLSNAEWTGKTISVGEIAYVFYVDSSTGKVIDFDPNSGYGEVIWSDISDENEDDLVDNESMSEESEDAEETTDDNSDAETNADEDNPDQKESGQ